MPTPALERARARLQAPRYLTAAEAAELFHVSRKTVTKWAQQGKLPCLRTLGGHRRYPEAEIRALASSLQSELVSDADVRRWHR